MFAQDWRNEVVQLTPSGVMYRVCGRLGRGGSADVFRVQCVHIPEAFQQDQEARRVFLRQRAQKVLNAHTNVGTTRPRDRGGSGDENSGSGGAGRNSNDLTNTSAAAAAHQQVVEVGHQNLDAHTRTTTPQRGLIVGTSEASSSTSQHRRNRGGSGDAEPRLPSVALITNEDHPEFEIAGPGSRERRLSDVEEVGNQDYNMTEDKSASSESRRRKQSGDSKDAATACSSIGRGLAPLQADADATAETTAEVGTGGETTEDSTTNVGASTDDSDYEIPVLEAGGFYALKSVMAHNQHEFQVFLREQELLVKLAGNPYVIHLLDYTVLEEERQLFLVLELAETDFGRFLSVNHNLSVQAIYSYWMQMVIAVRTMHRDHDVIHFDLKPANFLLVAGNRLKLADFGLARQLGDETTHVSRTNRAGTLKYMAPECIYQPHASKLRLGKPADVWSLGIILCRMIYNTTPHAHLQENHTRMLIAISDIRTKINLVAIPGLYTDERAPEEGSNEEEPTIDPDRKELHDWLINVARGCLIFEPRARFSSEELFRTLDLQRYPSESVVSLLHEKTDQYERLDEAGGTNAMKHTNDRNISGSGPSREIMTGGLDEASVSKMIGPVGAHGALNMAGVLRPAEPLGTLREDMEVDENAPLLGTPEEDPTTTSRMSAGTGTAATGAADLEQAARRRAKRVDADGNPLGDDDELLDLETGEQSRFGRGHQAEQNQEEDHLLDDVALLTIEQLEVRRAQNKRCMVLLIVLLSVIVAALIGCIVAAVLLHQKRAQQ